MRPKEQLIEWLGDAYAMEKGLCDTLKRHADEAGDHPDLQAAIRQHLQETERHAAELENALEALDESTSAIKTGLARAGGLFGGLSTLAAADTMVKNALSEYATEHFEIACYRSLIAAAKELGETSIAAVCERILADEEAMAGFLGQKIEELTSRHLLALGETTTTT